MVFRFSIHTEWAITSNFSRTGSSFNLLFVWPIGLITRNCLMDLNGWMTNGLNSFFLNRDLMLDLIFSRITMNTLQDHKVNVKLKLATLWVSFIFLYSYVDYLHLYMPGSIKSILEGKIFIFDISYSFLLVVMCLVTIPTSIYQ